jgi:hypothetical protein
LLFVSILVYGHEVLSYLLLLRPILVTDCQWNVHTDFPAPHVVDSSGMCTQPVKVRQLSECTMFISSASDRGSACAVVSMPKDSNFDGRVSALEHVLDSGACRVMAVKSPTYRLLL